MVAPLLDELSAEFDGRIKIVKCDVDQYEALSLRYGVTKIPNLSFFKDGEVVAQRRLMGYDPQPSGMQLVFYVVTAAVILVGMSFARRRAPAHRHARATA